MEANPKRYLYADGDLYLGTDEKRKFQLGITTPRHAITFAGARSGKGAACIIPNLKKWSESALVIDPKGEAAQETAADRAAMGQSVHVVDPFRFSSVDQRFLASYNPLDDLDMNSRTVREDINAISDGIIMRHNSEHAMWDNAAQAIISGLIAYIKTYLPPNEQNLRDLRGILRTDDALEHILDVMSGDPSCSGLMQNAANKVHGSKQGPEFLENARTNTDWIDSDGMDVLESSSFSMTELKNARASIYLVLPPDYLEEHGRFLRMFVRTALSMMARKTPSGSLLGTRCLFILDEMFSLGKIEVVQKSSGLMPGMGVILWPFFQDLGQLLQLYDTEGSETFFANADLHQFFANTDQLTLQRMSALTGTTSASEIGLPPTAPVGLGGGVGGTVSAMSGMSKNTGARVAGSLVGGMLSGVSQLSSAAAQADYQDKMNKYQQRMAEHGKPKYTPQEIAAKVQRRDDVVADNMLCVMNGSDVLFVKPQPFFRESHAKTVSKSSASGYAGFWIRTAALLIDIVLMMVFLLGYTFVVQYYYANIVADVNTINIIDKILVWPLFNDDAFAFIGGILFFLVPELSSWNATIGKKILGLQTLHASHGENGFWRTTGRFLLKITFPIVAITSAFTEKKQGLHDKLFKTIVVKDRF